MEVPPYRSTHHLRFGMSEGKFFRSVQSVDNEPLRSFLIETAGVVGSRPHLATQLPTQGVGTFRGHCLGRWIPAPESEVPDHEDICESESCLICVGTSRDWLSVDERKSET